MGARAKAISFDQPSFFTPESSWVPPTSLPDLSKETEVAIDTETRDDSIAKDKGPGFYKYEKTNPNTGFVCGISAAWRDQSVYIPLRHYRTTCFEMDVVQRWLRSLVAQNSTRFIFHNFQYDWGWLQAVFGIEPPALLDDTAAMASMINENLGSFSLENLCAWQGLPGKDETLLKEAMGQYKVPIQDIKQYIWRLEGKYIGPYAEQDAMSTLKLAQKLRPLLAKENLDKAYQVERDLMPITLKMKQRGIRVDLERTERLKKQIFQQCEDELFELSKELGERVSIEAIRKTSWIQGHFDRLKLKYYMTPASKTYPKGQPSFDKEFMAKHVHPFPRTVYRIKHQWDLADKFLDKFICKYEHKGRVFPSVNQFRSEYGGARSHRFSYADPPLQQMPSRDDEWAPLIRASFIPEEGEHWCSIDYRQQEFRLIVFIAECVKKRGANQAADMYRNNPDTDFHNYVAEITRLPRKRAKDVNFAKAYGAGISKFALMTGMDEEEARDIVNQYDEEMPFVRDASEHYARYAAENGHIRMIDGARNHFNMMEPKYRDFAREYEYMQKNPGVDISACSEEEFERRRNDPDHPWCGERPKRCFCHKAFNRMIQGSAARQIKKAMVNLYQAGYLSLLQIHDELGLSLSTEAQALECAKIMEECMPVITIPMLTDVKWGSSWGDLEKLTPK